LVNHLLGDIWLIAVMHEGFVLVVSVPHHLTVSRFTVGGVGGEIPRKKVVSQLCVVVGTLLRSLGKATETVCLPVTYCLSADDWPVAKISVVGE